MKAGRCARIWSYLDHRAGGGRWNWWRSDAVGGKGIDRRRCPSHLMVSRKNGQSMTQLMIYRSAVPVNRTTHHDCFVEVGPNYGFNSEVNSVPLTAIEFPYAAGEYPIVF